ncbi:MAG: hypothetical protein ACKO3T_16170 [Planctomycetaceae bacterium]
MSEETMHEPSVEVVWYGERGVINALIGQLSVTGVAGAQSLLKRATIWAAKTPPEWIDRIDSVQYIVEIGLGEFGDPDLMIVCHLTDGSRHLVFVEAKVISYAVSAIRNKDGMASRGFNSSINGQIALRYRFAHALQNWDGGAEIIEPEWVHRVYAQDIGGLADFKQQPRRLRKASVLHILRQSGLTQHPSANTSFIAMTWDRSAYFDHTGAGDEDLRPLLLNETGDDCWRDIRNRLGWIGYQAFGDGSGMPLEPEHPFHKALHTMVDSTTPPDQTQHSGFTPVATYNRREATDMVRSLLERLEADARQVFGQDAVKQYAGSTSIVISGKVLLKLIAHTGRNGGKPGSSTESVWLGVSASLPDASWTSEFFEDRWLIGIRNSPQPFYMKRLETMTALATAHDVFRQVWDLLGRPDADNLQD